MDVWLWFSFYPHTWPAFTAVLGTRRAVRPLARDRQLPHRARGRAGAAAATRTLRPPAAATSRMGLKALAPLAPALAVALRAVGDACGSPSSPRAQQAAPRLLGFEVLAGSQHRSGGFERSPRPRSRPGRRSASSRPGSPPAAALDYLRAHEVDALPPRLGHSWPSRRRRSAIGRRPGSATSAGPDEHDHLDDPRAAPGRARGAEAARERACSPARRSRAAGAGPRASPRLERHRRRRPGAAGCRRVGHADPARARLPAPARTKDGGFAILSGRESDAQSTAWAIQAFLAARARVFPEARSRTSSDCDATTAATATLRATR